MISVIYPKESITKLIREAERFTDAYEGQTVISEYVVMQATGGYYVGQFAIEYLDGNWIPMDWEGHTKFTKHLETAKMWLDALDLLH